MARAASSVIVALFMSRSSRWTKTVGQYGILRSEIRSEPKVWFGSRHKVAAIGIGEPRSSAPPTPPLSQVSYQHHVLPTAYLGVAMAVTLARGSRESLLGP